MDKRKLLEYGGIASGVILIAFGIGAVAMSINGHNTVVDSLKAGEDHERGDDGDDAVPDRRGCEGGRAALTTISLPTCSVEGKDINSSSKAQVLRASTCGSMRSSRPAASPTRNWAATRRRTASPKGTNDFAAAATTRRRASRVSNPARDTWVTETALSTALYVSFMADNLALFGDRRRRRAAAQRHRLHDPRHPRARQRDRPAQGGSQGPGAGDARHGLSSDARPPACGGGGSAALSVAPAAGGPTQSAASDRYARRT